MLNIERLKNNTQTLKKKRKVFVMTITMEVSLCDFEAWSGAVDTLQRIINADMCDELERILEDLYPEGMSDTELNDLLWFDSETVYEWLGMRTEEAIEEELDELREALNELMEEFAEECEELREENPEADFGKLEELRGALWSEEYADRSIELTEQIEALEDELNGF